MGDNNYLGKFTLKGIPKTLRGVPKIKVTFKIDTNGILEVSAEDQKAGARSGIQITNEKGRLSQKDIEKMLEEAEKYKGEDAITKGDLAAKESLRVYMSRVTDALGHIDQSKITGKDRERIDNKLADVTSWLDSIASAKAVKQDFDACQKALEAAFNTIMMKINRTDDDIWEQNAIIPDGEKTIANGGYFLHCGVDIRELMPDPE